LPDHVSFSLSAPWLANRARPVNSSSPAQSAIAVDVQQPDSNEVGEPAASGRSYKPFLGLPLVSGFKLGQHALSAGYLSSVARRRSLGR